MSSSGGSLKKIIKKEDYIMGKCTLGKWTLSRTYCANFTLKYEDGQTALEGYSEHVWMRITNEADEEDMLHFSLDSIDKPVGEICQIVADLGGEFEWDGWLDAYVPLSKVQRIAFEH